MHMAAFLPASIDTFLPFDSMVAFLSALLLKSTTGCFTARMVVLVSVWLLSWLYDCFNCVQAFCFPRCVSDFSLSAFRSTDG